MMPSPQLQQQFRTQLLHWFRHEHHRPLPWKEDKDPYKTWLSEIILQQTRVAQGLPYYLRFVEAYPAIFDLAQAQDDEVFKLWQGLGYYNRCKNLLHTARTIVSHHDGHFPNSYEGLLALKGIGPYTAAAIASMAFDLPVAVVDGNVFRVLARVFNVSLPIDSTAGKNHFNELAQGLVSEDESADYNQAIMDLGATICKPVNPLCEQCPLEKICEAKRLGIVQELPIKAKAKALKKRWFHYFLVTKGKKIWMHKRASKDIWQQLYEPLLIETHRATSLEKVVPILCDQLPHNAVKLLGKAEQKLTHQHLHFCFYRIHAMPHTCESTLAEGLFYNPDQLEKLPMPRTLHAFFSKNEYL